VNPYSALLNLLPFKPLLVGTVLAVTDDNCTVQQPGGGIQTARGAGYSVGQKVFFKDGAIQGVAPDLPIVITGE
jgi:hypothetical protein